MNKKDLPIGTVVLLTGGFKKVMITGYSSVSSEKENEVFDYNGCIFPEGLMENIYSLFNADQIEEIFYYGLENEEYKEYVENKKSVLENRHSSNNLEMRSQSSSTKERRKLRVPQAPTKPRSKTEMKDKYGITKISGKDDLPVGRN